MAESWFPDGAGVGAYIRARRELSRMSLRELSRLSQVSNAYLSQVERGLHEPSVRVLRAVASAMSIPLDELMRADGAAPAADPAPSADLADAIRAAPRLTRAQKEALLAVYRSFLSQEPPAGPDGARDEPPTTQDSAADGSPDPARSGLDTAGAATDSGDPGHARTRPGPSPSAGPADQP